MGCFFLPAPVGLPPLGLVYVVVVRFYALGFGALVPWPRLRLLRFYARGKCSGHGATDAVVPWWADAVPSHKSLNTKLQGSKGGDRLQTRILGSCPKPANLA